MLQVLWCQFCSHQFPENLLQHPHPWIASQQRPLLPFPPSTEHLLQHFRIPRHYKLFCCWTSSADIYGSTGHWRGDILPSLSGRLHCDCPWSHRGLLWHCEDGRRFSEWSSRVWTIVYFVLQWVWFGRAWSDLSCVYLSCLYQLYC